MIAMKLERHNKDSMDPAQEWHATQEAGLFTKRNMGLKKKKRLGFMKGFIKHRRKIKLGNADIT